MYELIYTSVPKGLIPGRSGFATVGMSEGMPPNLIVPLENLSGYNFTLRDNTFLDILNPPCCYYIKMRYGNQQLHIAGRVAPNGLDYSQRNNKIAHHLLFESADELENLSGGVAGLFLKPGVFRSEYTEEPAMLPFRKVPVCTQIGSLPAKTWAEFAGHAGFAAYTAERFRENPDKPLYLIYPAGTPVEKLLYLVMEVCAVLGERLRNYLTFSTYFGSSTAPVDCFLRMIPDFSPLVSNLRRFHKNDVIELGQENELPTTEIYSDLYEYACTGIEKPHNSENNGQSLTQHTIRILADSGLPPEPVRELLNDTPEFTVPPPEPPVSYRKFVFIGVAAVIIAAIASLLLYDMPNKTKKPAPKANKAAEQILQQPVKKPLTPAENVPVKPAATPDIQEPVKPEVPPVKPLPKKEVIPQAKLIKQDIFTNPTLLEKAIALPPLSELKLFISLNSIKSNTAQVKLELPLELQKTVLVYPVMERIGTSLIDNRNFVEKGPAGEVYIRSAQIGTLPLQPVNGDITVIPHLMFKISADKKYLQITNSTGNQLNCIMPEISKIKKIYFQLPDKVYLMENKFSDKYISLIKPGNLTISGNKQPLYVPHKTENILRPFVIKKFGNCPEATFLASSFYLEDWNNAIKNYKATALRLKELKKTLKQKIDKKELELKTKITTQPRSSSEIKKCVDDIKKKSQTGNIADVEKPFVDFLDKFFNPNEKNLISADELKKLSKTLADNLKSMQYDKSQLEKVDKKQTAWNKKIDEIASIQQLQKSIAEEGRKLEAARQKRESTANRMLHTAKSVHTDIEILLQKLMKGDNAPSWQITPAPIGPKKASALSHAILKKTVYELSPDGE